MIFNVWNLLVRSSYDQGNRTGYIEIYWQLQKQHFNNNKANMELIETEEVDLKQDICFSCGTNSLTQK